MSYEIRQGYVRQNGGIGRIVTVEGLAHKINEYIRIFGPVLFGTITLKPDALYQYGILDCIQNFNAKALLTFQFRHAETEEEMKLDIPYSAISLTHDVEYTVEDENRGTVTYPVFYVTATDGKAKQSVTYYVGSRELVSRPLDCIADFFVRSHKVGQDMELPDRRSCMWHPPSP